MTGLALAQVLSFWDSLGINNHSTTNITSIIIFLLSSFLTIKIAKPENKKALLLYYIIFIVAWFFWDILIRLIEGWKDSIFTLPRLLCQIAAIYASYTISTKSTKIVTLGFLILGIIYTTATFVLQPLASNYTTYGHFTPNINEILPKDLHIKEGNNYIKSEKTNNSYLILDFWNINCNVCFAKFPILQDLHSKNFNKKTFKFYSVQILYNKVDSSVGIEKLKAKGYTFPILYGDSTTCKLFKISSFPTTIILHNGKLIFRGDINDVNKILTTL